METQFTWVSHMETCPVDPCLSVPWCLLVIDRQQNNVTSAPSPLAGEGQGEVGDKNDISLLTGNNTADDVGHKAGRQNQALPPASPA